MHKGAKAELEGAQGATRLCTQCGTLAQTAVPKLLGPSPHLEYKVGGRRSREKTEVLSPTQEQQLD